MKAIPTIYDGIQFRSRTEASWYAFFKMAGAQPVYEPEAFELRRPGGDFLCNYLPDFQVTIFDRTHEPQKYYVEIKSNAANEGEDIAKACILGYKHPTLIITGWVKECAVAVINERHKGSPMGYWGHLYREPWKGELGGREVEIEHHYLDLFIGDEIHWYCEYPDETGIGVDPISQKSLADFEVQKKVIIGNTARIAADAWNATQWKPKY